MENLILGRKWGKTMKTLFITRLSWFLYKTLYTVYSIWTQILIKIKNFWFLVVKQLKTFHGLNNVTLVNSNRDDCKWMLTKGDRTHLGQSRFFLVSPYPLRQKCFFLLRSFVILAPTPLIFFNGVTSKL